MSADFLELVSTRRSIRRYLDRAVPVSLVEKMIEAASKAPSAHNAQPWHFIVVFSREERHKIARAMSVAYQKSLIKQGLENGLVQKKTTKSLNIFMQAPVFILPFLIGTRTRAGLREEFRVLEKTMALQSVALATGHFLLAASAYGLGACWFSAPLFCPEVIRNELKLGKHWEPQALVTLGYPAETGSHKKLRLLKEIVTYIK